MLTERAQRQVERLLDEADEAINLRDWAKVLACAQDVLRLDPENQDALAYVAAAQRDFPGLEAAPQSEGHLQRGPVPEAQPTSFCEGRYEVKRFLGQGGKKRVYLAHDTKLDRDVAFALIKTDGLDEDGLLRIKREAQAMGRLGDHPHIVSVYDIGDEPSTASGQVSRPYLVSQLMGGGDVEGLIERAPEHRVPLDQALRIADEVCRALEHAHGHGVVHRDLKPGNVWLTADGTAKLGDFGLALALDRTRLTQAGMMVGTVSYMPPEQALGGEVTARSDLYSLGAMLYELVTGRPPFVGDESVAIITQHLNTPPVAPSWHAPDVPPGLEALILRLLEKDPAKRPASAGEVRQALAGARARPHPNPLPEGEGKDASPPGRRRLEGQGEGVSSPQFPTPSPQPPGPNPLYRRAFVGREAESRQLQGAFDAALSGQGSLIAVVGEPGIGKTALCEQIATYVAVRGGRTLVGHCYEEGSLSVPYLPFIEALRTYVLARDPEGLRQDLGTGAADVARIVSEIRDRLNLEPLTPQASSLTPSSDPDEDRWRLYQAIAGFLRNASAVQPLLMILEDLHWADRGTLDLLVYLARQLSGTRLVIVGNYRDVEVDRTHPLSATLAELRRGSAFLRIPLRGLTADEVARMMSAIAGQEVAWSLAEAVHRQTEGNPLFVQEVLRYLAEEGLVHREDGRWQRGAGPAPIELSIPEGLRDVIGKRLSRLSPECNRLLTVAAVIGRDFRLDTLQTVADISEDEVLPPLEEALRVGVLEDQSHQGQVRYRFAHAFFRQTLYEELITPRRLRLHQQVARALEAQHASRLEEHAAELAEHFAQSSDPAELAKAVGYGRMAARRASAVYAFGETTRLLRGAVQVQELADPDDRETRCDLLLDLAEAMGPAGEPLGAAEEIAPQAFALAQALEDRARSFRACRAALLGLRRYGGGSSFSTPAYQRWAERVAQHAAPETAEHAFALTHLANARLGTGLRAESWELQMRAIDLARRLGNPALLFEAAERMVIGGFPTPQHEPARRDIAEELLALPRDGIPLSALSAVLWYAGQLRLGWGDRAGAEEVWAEVDALAERTRDPLALVFALQTPVSLATLDGDLEGAVRSAEELQTRAEVLGMEALGRQQATFTSTYALLGLGRTEEALKRQMALRELGGMMQFGSGTSLCLAHLGRRAEAQALVTERYGERAGGADPHSLTTTGLNRLLEIAVLLGDAEMAARLAPALEPLRHLSCAGPGNDTCIARHLGAAAALCGDRDAARGYYAEALEVAGRVRHRPEIALIRLQTAELLLDEAEDDALTLALSQRERETRRAEALGHLDFAIEEFRVMKMQPSLERALRHKGLLRA